MPYQALFIVSNFGIKPRGIHHHQCPIVWIYHLKPQPLWAYFHRNITVLHSPRTVQLYIYGSGFFPWTLSKRFYQKYIHNIEQTSLKFTVQGDGCCSCRNHVQAHVPFQRTNTPRPSYFKDSLNWPNTNF